MITEKYQGKPGLYKELAGLSTDTKPTDVANGSTFDEIDTGKTYMFDAEGGEWHPFDESGGGGGGGGGTSDYDDLSNKPISLSQPKFTQDDSIGTGYFMGTAITKVSNKVYPISELVGGKVTVSDVEIPLTPDKVADITQTISAMGYTGSMCTVITPSGDITNLDYVMMSFDVDFTFAAYGMSVTAGTYIATLVDELDLPEVTVVNPKYASNFLPSVSASDAGKGIGVYGGKWGLTEGSPINGLASYANIPLLLGSGGDYMFPLWSQIRAMHDEYGEIVFDVVDVDGSTHDLTLLMHDCLSGLEMDASEALVVCDSGLPAGTYYFDATSVSRYSDWQKSWGFTLTQAVPAGGVLRPEIDLLNWVPINMRSYTSQLATTPIETVTMSESSSGTDLTTVIASAKTNDFDRAVAGNGNYEESAMHKYLTSDDGPGEWWTPSSIWDMAPSYAGKAGFMAGFSDEFLAILAKTTQVCATNYYYEDSDYTLDSYYSVQAKFFLPSLTQLCGHANGYNDGVDEGSQWGAYASAQYGQDNDVLVKYTRSDHNNPTWWWQRSCDPWDPDRFRVVNTGGNPSSNDSACLPFSGVAVACVISAI